MIVDCRWCMDGDVVGMEEVCNGGGGVMVEEVRGRVVR